MAWSDPAPGSSSGLPEDPDLLERRAAARLVDDDAMRVARRRNAVEVAIGETLDVLFRGNRLLKLGYSKGTDYARERLGVRPRSMFLWLRLARGLKDRPLLRRAVLADAVTPRHALAVLPVAMGDEERRWTAAAMSCTVAELEKAVRSRGHEPVDGFEAETLWLRMTPDQQDRLDRAISVAGTVEGFGAARWRCVEAMCQEWLGAHGAWVPPEEGAEASVPRDPPPLEAVARQIDAAEEAISLTAGPDEPGDLGPATDAASLDARARRLVAAHRDFDAVFGPLARHIVDGYVWWLLGYDSLDDYSRERLGMSARTVRERVWLERRMDALPELREALSSGRLSYSKVLLLARDATAASVEERIADAATTTCQQVGRDATAAEDRRNRAAGVRRLWGPKDAAAAVADAILSAQEWSRSVRGVTVDAGEALALIADHFVAVWEPIVYEQRMPGKVFRVLSRHEGMCAVPGCTRTARHRHHVVYRSRGGGDEDWNLIAVCTPHHLRAIHRGHVRVTGRAGERLVWEFGTMQAMPIETWVTTGNDDVRRGVA